MKAQSESEERLFNELLQEREKINYFWIVEKKEEDDLKASYRNKEREYQDAEEKFDIEMKVLKQRVKHLRYHQHDETTQQRIAIEHALKLLEDEDRSQYRKIMQDVRDGKINVKEGEVAHFHYKTLLRLRQDEAIFRIREAFERRAREMHLLYKQKLDRLRADRDSQRNEQLMMTETKKSAQVASVMQENVRKLHQIKQYFFEKTNANHDLIKRLKEDHESLRKHERTDANTLAEAISQNNKKRSPLNRARELVKKLTQKAAEFKQQKANLARVKSVTIDTEKNLQNADLRVEILQQQLERATAVRDELTQKFRSTVYDLQQKTGFQNLLLEKQLETLGESLEITEAQLAELLVSAGVEQPTVEGISTKLTQMLVKKKELIEQLTNEIEAIKAKHDLMVRTSEARLMGAGMKAEDIGFEPLLD